MSDWAEVIADLDARLSDWEAFLENPDSEPLPDGRAPELPTADADPAVRDRVVELANRVEGVRSRLVARQADVQTQLERVRKVQSAATAYLD